MRDEEIVMKSLRHVEGVDLTGKLCDAKFNWRTQVLWFGSFANVLAQEEAVEVTMNPKVWLITGCSSDFGREFALAALARGDKVVATAPGSNTRDRCSRDWLRDPPSARQSA